MPAQPRRRLNLQPLLLVLLLLPASAATAVPPSSATLSPAEARAADEAARLAPLRAAVRQRPAAPLPHAQLALALHELNHQSPDGGSRVAEAEREYRAALALIDPAGAQAGAHLHIRGNLGALLLSADRPAQAITELQAALDAGKALLAQHSSSSSSSSASSSSKKQQHKQPEQERELAADVQRQLGGLAFNLGKALTSLGRLDEADAVYGEAAAAALGQDLASYGKALAASRSVTDAAARQAAQVASLACQHFATAQQQQLGWLQSAGLAAAGDSGAQQHQQLAGPWITDASSEDVVWLLFALHKHHHANRRFKTAWRYLAAGNRIMAGLSPYNSATDTRNLASILAIFRAPWTTSLSATAGAAAAAAAAGEDGGAGEEEQQGDTAAAASRQPIFVVGMPRSGSTLVEQMLASHPDVWAAGEDTALAPLTPEINRALAAGVPPEQQPALLARFARRYLAAMAARVPPNWAGAGGGAGGTGPGSSSEEHAGASSEEHAGSSSSSGRRAAPARIVDKMLRNLWLAGYIHMLLPRACIVHVVRHPLDVATSCFAQPFGYSAAALAWSWDLAAIGQQLAAAWQLADHWDAQLPPGRVHTVYYEQLVQQPEAVARQLLDACGLPWDAHVLQFHHAASNRSVQTASTVQVRQPLYRSAVGRWRVYGRHLAALAEELAPLVGRYEEALRQRGVSMTSDADTEAADAGVDAAPSTAGRTAAAGEAGDDDGRAASAVKDEL